MKTKYTYSVLVYIKKKYAYSRREEQIQVLADALKGRFMGGGTDLFSGKRDQQFYFQNLESVKTFLDYPTVKEAILSDIKIVNLESSTPVLNIGV
jgi:hypothetical protein